MNLFKNAAESKTGAVAAGKALDKQVAAEEKEEAKGKIEDFYRLEPGTMDMVVS